MRRGPLRTRDAATSDAAQLAAWWNDGAIVAPAGCPRGLGNTPAIVSGQLAGESGICSPSGTERPGEMHYRNEGGGTASIGIKICEAAQQG